MHHVSAPRRSTPWWLRLIVAVAVLTGTIAAVHGLGLAGYRVGWVWTGAPLAASVAVAWWLLGTGFPGRAAWVAAFAVVAVTAMAWSVDHAAMSKPRLADALDKLEPAFLTLQRERVTGHSWCRPSCPRVERTYKAPALGGFGVLLNVAAEMRLEGLLPNLTAVGQHHPTRYLRVQGERYRVQATVTKQGDTTLLTLTITATRGRVKPRTTPQMAATVTARTRSFLTSISAFSRSPSAPAGRLTLPATRRTVPSLKMRSSPSMSFSSPV